MSAGLQIRHDKGRRVEIATNAGQLLWRYNYAPDTPINEARRPYVHPICSLAGDVLTNFRPNDHPWHHALSVTLTSVDAVNFWGGPSYRAEDGYQWREDHGVQRHCSWSALQPERMEQEVEWCEPRTNAVMLRERRSLRTAIVGGVAWSLRWTSELVNASGRELNLGNYHASGGLAGSHYTGLQFRGARDLLDEHGDAAIAITAEGGRKGEAEIHGTAGRWMEWACQHDGSLRRTRIRFEAMDTPVAWFVRAKNPLAAFAFHRERPQSLAIDATLRLDHTLTFSCA